MMGFDGTVQYMARWRANADAGSDYCGSYSARHDINRAGFSPVRWRCCLFSTLGTAVIGHWDMTGDDGYQI